LLPPAMTRAKARPPQPRESSHAHHSHTCPGAEGGGGWPMHATAQPWHVEGRPLTTGALGSLLSPAARTVQVVSRPLEARVCGRFERTLNPPRLIQGSGCSPEQGEALPLCLACPAFVSRACDTTDVLLGRPRLRPAAGGKTSHQASHMRLFPC
jgi:hypothetical protein